MADALTLADFRAELIGLACHRRDRRGQYRRTTLIALYGDKTPLPDVLAQVAHDCPKRGTIDNDACGAYFPDLVERQPRRPPRNTPARRSLRIDGGADTVGSHPAK